jgi:hypothetical protein
MRAADQPLTVEIRASRWVAAVPRLLTGLALASMAAWLTALEPLDLAQWTATVAAALLTAGVAVAVWRQPPQPVHCLGWDGRQWWLAPTSASRDQPHWQGHLHLVWRLGGCWLLRGQADTGSAGRRTLWLSVDARALGAQAHGLLCALYCARRSPASGAPGHIG